MLYLDRASQRLAHSSVGKIVNVALEGNDDDEEGVTNDVVCFEHRCSKNHSKSAYSECCSYQVVFLRQIDANVHVHEVWSERKFRNSDRILRFPANMACDR